MNAERLGHQKVPNRRPDLRYGASQPKINGIEAARRIRKVAPESKILFLSQEIDVDVADLALTYGFAAIEVVTQGESS